MKKLINKMWISASPMAIFLVLVMSVIPLSAFEAHVVNVTAKIERRSCVLFETRSYGFWKTHPEVRIYPQTLGTQIISTEEEADAIFALPDKIMMNKLKKQLLALKFNVSFYNSGTALVPGESTTTINELIAEADAEIAANPPASKDELEDMKDRLESANTAETLSTCPGEKGDDGKNDDEDKDDDNGDKDKGKDEKDHDKDKDEKDEKQNSRALVLPGAAVATSTAPIASTTTSATSTDSTTSTSTTFASSTAPAAEEATTTPAETSTTTPESGDTEADANASTTTEAIIEPESAGTESAGPGGNSENPATTTEPALIVN